MVLPLNKFSTALLLCSLAVIATGYGKTEVDVDAVLSCDIKAQVIPVTVTDAAGNTTEIMSSEIIEASTDSTIHFAIPENTGSILREVYSNPDATEAGIDNAVTTIPADQVAEHETMRIDMSKTTTDTVVRYFLCDQDSANCYPSCYQAQLIVRTLE